MKPELTVAHEFVEFIPDVLELNTVYISIQYRVAIHLCVCGCGNKVVTPISPTAWKLTYDGEKVTLDPSIGNWSFPCQSHYWIRGSKIRWAPRWSAAEIAEARMSEQAAMSAYYDQPSGAGDEDAGSKSQRPRPKFWRRIADWLKTR